MRIVCCILMMMFISGCAVQRYGRMIPVVPSEEKSFTCEQITIEIDKCNAFIREVIADDKKLTGGDILAFLGDFGIGDSWEVKDAIASATGRITGLEKLREKKCP